MPAPPCPLRSYVPLSTITAALIVSATSALAQPDPGPYLEDVSGPRVHAIVGATIVPEAGQILDSATLIVRNGIIEAFGPDVPVPPDARIWNAEGLTVYPGLIDPYLRVSRLSSEEKKPAPSTDGPPNEPPAPGDGHPHPRVHPEHYVTDGLDLSDGQLEELRGLGFTAAYLVPDDGIFRGRGAMIALRAGRSSDLEIAPARSQCIAYDTGRDLDDYPRSIMGVVALQRQTFLDTRHYLEATRIYAAHPQGLEHPERNRSFDALGPAAEGREAVIIETDDVLATLRAGRLAREFGLQTILCGSGEEQVYLDQIRALGYPIILPLAFPDAPYFEDDLAAYDVSLRSLRNWNRAPSNPKALADAGVRFALTTDRLRKASFLPRMVRAAIRRGLSADDVLRGFTTEAARIHGVDDRVGTIARGKIANLTITDGDLVALGTRVRQVWVDGEPHLISEPESERDDPLGLWRIELTGTSWTDDGVARTDEAENALHGSWLQVDGKTDSLVVTWMPPSIAGTRGQGLSGASVDSSYAGSDTLEVMWGENEWGLRHLFLHDPGFTPRIGYVEVGDRRIEIRGEHRRGGEPTEEEQKKEAERPALVPAPFPEGPIESPSEVLVRNATIWTCGPQGILESANLLVRNGRIVQVGPGLTAGPDVKIVDGTGLHVTPGLMDCHSHSMIVGDVNEATLASSAMVRIEDVLDSRSLNVYRHLAGGLTLSDQVHGSANPIGGQNAVVKMRWGADPDGLLVQGAPPGIKFALGENVTQTSWGEAYTTRYPKSRMGVEQWIRDRFLTAIDYAEAWKEYGALSASEKTRTIPPRRDLELDALVEVLNGERFVDCHAYRQDEILMLMRLAESYGFRVRTFQHILEGYKVANEMAVHGAMASGFSDWWAYKPEVWDAIPYNAALMHERGVNVTMNSDSAELARRMNLEATKAIKWGGVDPEEALKMVTLNTAIQLGIDDHLGSLEPGKDADFVLWSGSPHSTGSICLQTWVDGELYFDRNVDLERRALTEAERAKLLALALEARPASRDQAQGPPRPTSYELGEAEEHSCGQDYGEDAGEESGSMDVDAESGTMNRSGARGSWTGGGR